MPKVILLAGAPQGRNWREEDLTLNKLLPIFSYFNDIVDGDPKALSSRPVEGAHLSTSPLPLWRSIALHDEHLPTGWTEGRLRARDQLAVDEDVEFRDRDIDLSYLTASETSFGPANEDNDITHFLEQSFALHEDGDQSQLTPAAKTPLTAALRQAAITQKHPTGPTFPALPNLTALSILPIAATLTRLEPQTVTVDLICGIISAPAARSIVIRRTGRLRELVELIVGDETKAGVIVTFWLPETRGPKGVSKTSEDSGLREQILALRPGHVVCMRNIALRSFRGVVQGQSLGWSTNLTRLDDRLKMDAEGQTPESVIAAKIERVRDWTRQFVRRAGVKTAVPTGTGRKRSFASLVGEDLPLDETQIEN